MNFINGTIYDMNYLFLKKVEDKIDNDYLDVVLRNFLESLSIAIEHDEKDSIKLLKKLASTELSEGNYKGEYTESEFLEMLRKAIKDIFGEHDDNVFDLYAQLYNEVSSEEKMAQ